jgi:NADH-quinone oxidoreductase subunit A
VNLENYFPVLLFILVGIGVGVAPQSSVVFSVPQAGRSKTSPYECGFEAFEDARMKFDVRYYLIAILFILFDLKPPSSSRGACPCVSWAGKVSSR